MSPEGAERAADTRAASTRAQRRRAARAEREAQERAAQRQAARQRRRRVLLGVGAAALLATAAVIALFGGSEPSTAGRDGASPVGVRETSEMLAGIPQDGVVLGRSSAPVTVTEFVDLQCPFCRVASEQILPAVIEEEVRPGRVRLERRLLTFLGPDSEAMAAAAAAAARAGRFWHLTELFLRNQGAEGSGYADTAYLRRVAGAVPGLDVEATLARARQPPARGLIAGDERLAARLGVASTPTFLVGRTGSPGRPVDARAPEDLREAIRAARR